jgi:hypothetical protein
VIKLHSGSSTGKVLPRRWHAAEGNTEPLDGKVQWPVATTVNQSNYIGGQQT